MPAIRSQTLTPYQHVRSPFPFPPSLSAPFPSHNTPFTPHRQPPPNKIARILSPRSSPPHLRPISQQLRRILLKRRIRLRTLLPPQPTMLNAADGPRTNDSGYETADTGVDADFGTGGERVETVGNRLGGRGGEGFSGCGVAAEEVLVGESREKMVGWER